MKAERQVPPRVPQRGGGALGYLATAALVLLTLAVGFFAMRPRSPETQRPEEWSPALVRALAATTGSVVDTPLAEATFTLEELPSGDKQVIYYRLTLPPGASLPYLAAPYCGCLLETITEGVGVEAVQAGAYTLRLDVPVRVRRAGETRPSEEIPAGREVTLAKGDAAIYPNYAATGDVRNAGEEPVTLAGVAIVGAVGSGTLLPAKPMGVTALLLTQSLPADWEAIPPGPVHVALRQVTLAPGTSVGPYQPVGLEALRIESGTLVRSFVRDGAATPASRPLAQLTGTTTPFMRPSPGMREVLASEGTKPAELLVLIIEPAVASLQSLAP